jgi:hypothetical protein
MLETLCILLTNNEQNKLEFARLDGYQVLSNLFMTIQPSEQEFVTNSLRILRNIILNGEGGLFVGNPAAFTMVFRIGATSEQLYTISEVFGIVKEILTLSWENVLPVILDETCLDYISTLLCRIAVSDPASHSLQPILIGDKGVDAKEKAATYEAFRELMLYISCIAGSFWE